MNQPNSELQIRRIPLSHIEVAPERRARLKEPVVIETLMPSIQRCGLLSPVRVTPGKTPGTYVLICGLHRLVAHERLGLTDIAAVVVEGDPRQLELDEVEEDLARKDLTVLERARLERRQRDLYLVLHPETRQGVAGGKARQGQQASSKTFADAEAKEGSGKRMVQRRIQVAEALPDDIVDLIADTPVANNLTQLLELAKAPEKSKRDIAAKIAEGKTADVKAAARELLGIPKLPPPPKDPEARAQLVKGADGSYTATAYLMGREVLVTIPGSLAYVDLMDKGQGQAMPVYAGDDDALTFETVESVVRETLAELPHELAKDIEIQSVRKHTHEIELLLIIVRPTLKGPEPTPWRLSWMTPLETKAVNRTVEIKPEYGTWGWRGCLYGRPTRGAFRTAFRDHLAQHVFRHTHKVTRPMGISKPIQGDVMAIVPGVKNATPKNAAKLTNVLVSQGFKKAEVKAYVESLGANVDSKPLETLLREALDVLTPKAAG